METYNICTGKSWAICDSLLDEHHIVIGGTTGSGKSVFLNSIMYSALIHSPVKYQFLFIDQKRVELQDYKNLPHTLAYCTEIAETITALDKIIGIMERRYKDMQTAHTKEYNGNHIWVVIDELADLMQQAPQTITGQLAKIMRLGRAARIHVLACTQSPNRRCLPAELCQNTTAAVALRCRSSIESRQIIGINGAELLPRYGVGLFWNAEGTKRIVIPKTSDKDLKERIAFWS